MAERHRSDDQATGRESTVFLTGATGFIGAAVVAHILDMPRPRPKLLLLVRAANPHEALRRIQLALSRFGVPPHVLNDDVRVLPGDLSEAGLEGLEGIDSVSHVLHLAADTSFRSGERSRLVNIDGSLALARRVLEIPRLQRYLHVSTAMICGAHPPRVVHEDDYPAPGVEHLVAYTAAKAEAELLVGRLYPQLPMVVARPSIVVGHTRLGCSPSASLFWAFRAVDALGRTPWPLQNRIDVVPVDWVAESLTRLLLAPTLRHRRYHLSAGDSGSPTWHEISAAFSRARGRTRTYSGPSGRIDRWPREMVLRALGPGASVGILRVLARYFQFGELDVAFDNNRLREEGILQPPGFSDYLKRCLDIPAGRTIRDQMKDDGESFPMVAGSERILA